MREFKFAISEALSGRPGPVLLDIPLDIQAHSDKKLNFRKKNIDSLRNSPQPLNQDKIELLLEKFKMAKNIDFYFDFGSPTAYLAFTQLQLIAKRNGVNLIFHPILLGGIFKATGNSPPAAIPAKGKYMMRDLQRYAEKYQVPYERNPFFPVNTLSLSLIHI